MIKQAYINGFMRKCAEHGVDGRKLLQKQARDWSWMSDAISSAAKKIRGLFSGSEDLGKLHKKVVGEPGVRVPPEAVADAQLHTTLRTGRSPWASRPILAPYEGAPATDARVMAARAKLRADPRIAEHPIIGPRIREFAATEIADDIGGRKFVTDSPEKFWVFGQDEALGRDAMNARLAEYLTGYQIDGNGSFEPTFMQRLYKALENWDPDQPGKRVVRMK